MANQDNKPAAWAEEAVSWATAAGLMHGDENGNLKLHDACTRQEVCVLLYRLHQLLGS